MQVLPFVYNHNLLDNSSRLWYNIYGVRTAGDQVPEYVEIEELRHVEYVGPYMHESDVEIRVIIVIIIIKIVIRLIVIIAIIIVIIILFGNNSNCNKI